MPECAQAHDMFVYMHMYIIVYILPHNTHTHTHTHLSPYFMKNVHFLHAMYE